MHYGMQGISPQAAAMAAAAAAAAKGIHILCQILVYYRHRRGLTYTYTTSYAPSPPLLTNGHTLPSLIEERHSTIL
jgi:hypothetical protein